MTEIIPVFTSRAVDKDLYFLELMRLKDWPAHLRGLSRHFGLFLAWDASAVPDETVLTIARRTVEQGLAYLCTWGPDCLRVHDLFDTVMVEKDPKPTGESVIMSTWHSDEPLDEALWYFMYSALPADDYSSTCQSWVVVAVDHTEWAAHIRRRLADPKRFSLDVLAADTDENS